MGFLPGYGGRVPGAAPSTPAAYPKRFLEGFRILWRTAATLTIGTGSCRDSADGTDINLTAALVVDITTAGDLGLDTGAEAANTWYYVHVIASDDGATVSAMLSASSSAPTLPAGYSVFRRIGAVRNDGASNFLGFQQLWTGTTRRYRWEAEVPVITNCTSTSFVAVDCQSCMPPTSQNGLFKFIFENVGGLNVHGFRVRNPDFADLYGYVFKPGIVLTNDAHGEFEFPTTDTQGIEVRNFSVSNTTDLYIAGYDEELE